MLPVSAAADTATPGHGSMTLSASSIPRAATLWKPGRQLVERRGFTPPSARQALSSAHAAYEGLRPDPTREKNPYNKFIDETMAA
jgi:hypothetical protein